MQPKIDVVNTLLEDGIIAISEVVSGMIILAVFFTFLLGRNK